MKKLLKKYFPLLKNESGSSLVLALIISFVAIILLSIVVHYSNTELKSAKKQDDRQSAYYIAEAGVERAIHEINHSLEAGKKPESYVEDLSFEGGSYKAWIDPIFNDQDELVHYEIESIGTYKNEERKIIQLVKQPITPPSPSEDPEHPNMFNFAIYASGDIHIQTLSGLLGIGLLETHPIKVHGNIHGNKKVTLKHNGILTSNPKVNGTVSSTNLNHINIKGLNSNKRKTYNEIEFYQFDFDQARKEAKESGVYVPHSVLDISLLGLSPSDKIIFIDGNLTIAGLDLLGISLQDRTIVVNGTISGLLELGTKGKAIDSTLNLIAKEDINFIGLLTGLKVNGILLAEGNINTQGHLAVNGFAGAKNINCGSGLVSGITGILTGAMEFRYDPTVFEKFPSELGFKKSFVEVVD